MCALFRSRTNKTVYTTYILNYVQTLYTCTANNIENLRRGKSGVVAWVNELSALSAVCIYIVRYAVGPLRCQSGIVVFASQRYQIKCKKLGPDMHLQMYHARSPEAINIHAPGGFSLKACAER